MQRSFGLYRRTFGAKIVESFYDFETHTIGPYTIPVNIQYSAKDSSGNRFSKYKYYELMRNEEDLLAVFNNNNYCFVTVRRNLVKFVPYFNSDFYYKKQLPQFPISPPIQLPDYKHIGYIKTYQECKAVYTWPWYLFGNLATGEIYDFTERITGVPLENPPLTLYKILIGTEFDAVYFNTLTMTPVFIKN